MLFYLKELAFVKLIIPFTIGIIASVFLPFEIDLGYLIISALGLFLLLMFLNLHRGFQKRYKLRWVNGILVSLAFFCAGYVLCRSRTEIDDARHFSHYIDEESKLAVKIIEPVVEKEKSFKTIAEVLSLEKDSVQINTFGKILIYFKKDSLIKDIKYGDILLIKNKLNPLPSPQNPHEFDYKEFMGFRQIHFQCFLTSEDWVKTAENKGTPVYAQILELRSSLFAILKKHIKDEHALSVASSLLLGLREKLDDEVIQAYSSSGAMHVLAVSGLHVGILYFIINWMLFFLDKTQKTKVLKSIIIVAIIWGYACLTGLSPSVLRAAVMFTFVAGAENIRRSTNIYNVLAGSAFLLLLINPYLIMEVGFQLSYAAVVGIVLIQPWLYNLIYTRIWLLDKIWMIISVSIAAQVATFPIGLLYFHQFPVYFFVSNLFVIPAAMIILYLGLGLFLFSFFDFAEYILGWLLEWVIFLLNKVIFFIESLPFSLLQGLTISVFDSWLIYIFIAGMIAFIYLKRIRFVQVALIALALFFALHLIKITQQQKQQRFLVYNIPRHSAIDFIDGKQNLLITDKELLQDYDKMLFHIKHNWWESGVTKTGVANGFDENLPLVANYKNNIQFKDKRIVIINQPPEDVTIQKKLKVDYLIISKSPKLRIKALTHLYDFDEVIFDSSNSRWRISRWKQECAELGISYFDVNENGAFVLEI